MHRSRRLLTALTILLAGLFAGATAAQAAPRTVIFNLTTEPLDRPATFYLQADAGPSVRGLQWSGWGAEGAVGTGTWTLDCSSGGGDCARDQRGVETHPARLRLSGLTPCPRFGPDAMTYRFGILEIDFPSGTTQRRYDGTLNFCAKRPTVPAAKVAVKRYLLQRGPAGRLLTTCKVTGPLDLECTARFVRGGKRRTQGLFVSARLNKTPRVTPFGS